VKTQKRRAAWLWKCRGGRLISWARRMRVILVEVAKRDGCSTSESITEVRRRKEIRFPQKKGGGGRKAGGVATFELHQPAERRTAESRLIKMINIGLSAERRAAKTILRGRKDVRLRVGSQTLNHHHLKFGRTYLVAPKRGGTQKRFSRELARERRPRCGPYERVARYYAHGRTRAPSARMRGVGGRS